VRFPTFQWHYYEFAIPAGAVPLARSNLCPQAFRLGDSVWAVQFHPEITRPILESWLAEAPEESPGPPADVLVEFDRRADEWNAVGRILAGNFVEAAARVAVTA
jgi:hypothetical protein